MDNLGYMYEKDLLLKHLLISSGVLPNLQGLAFVIILVFVIAHTRREWLS